LNVINALIQIWFTYKINVNVPNLLYMIIKLRNAFVKKKKYEN
jgi:hypothetical protein